MNGGETHEKYLPRVLQLHTSVLFTQKNHHRITASPKSFRDNPWKRKSSTVCQQFKAPSETLQYPAVHPRSRKGSMSLRLSALCNRRTRPSHCHCYPQIQDSQKKSSLPGRSTEGVGRMASAEGGLKLHSETIITLVQKGNEPPVTLTTL